MAQTTPRRLRLQLIKEAIEIIAGVKPADASKNVELLYRINSRPIGKSIKATFLSAAGCHQSENGEAPVLE